MNTGEEIHLTQDNRFMCKEDFLAHTKSLCKTLPGKQEREREKDELRHRTRILLFLLQR